ncbi:Gamma-glutamylputrescine oxidoreductase [Roseovarius litorisediminis]|uniref:Gamma-glutamylputrescine oxidoreductase n=1 Tax=Roseovarius litorisediminis TaxID=1312363 RepID=A0A1Y5RJ54_9RHOB|nr:FAD-binding oxidoreductase [Roseovarius litorisediminis]SLN18545.1 Gamma-glutamylputrescine oxidoreductase [Roseovarius litorisediminis]
MRQIFPAYTYGEGPRAGCYWPDTVSVPARLAATGRISCDIAVIGAGFTGLSAALNLAEAGSDVVVVDAQSLGWGASGRNGGFCCLGGSAASDSILTKLHGEPARREFRTAEHRAVDLTASLIKKHNIACDTHSDGETLMAHTQKAMDGFEDRAKTIERDYGVTPTILQQSDLAGHGMTGPFFGAITNPIGFALNPLKYSLGLADAAQKAGARIFSDTPVQRIDQQGGFTLTTPDATIIANRLIVATNGYSSDDLPQWLRARYLPTQSNVIVTRPMSDKELDTQGWTTHQMSYDDRFLLHYFRLMPNKQMLFGMRGGLASSAAADARMYRLIRTHFETMFPAWTHVETPYSWQGLLSISRDLTPYAGPIPEMPGAFTAISYHGNGVAMGTYAGALLADMAQDRTLQHLHPKIMQTPPKRFPLGRFRRATLWPLYAYAMVVGG